MRSHIAAALGLAFLSTLASVTASSVSEDIVKQEWEVGGASKRSIRKFVITEKAPPRAFSWLKGATTAFTFKTQC